jgi:hypothetical protein
LKKKRRQSKLELMPEETPQLPVSEQEVQIQAPSFLERLQTQKKKILIGLGAFLGVLILAGAAFGIYQYAQNQIPLEPTPTPLPSETSVKEGDPTADWETYTNTKYRYSIRYSKESELFEVGETTSTPPDEWQATGIRLDSLEIQLLSYENKENLSSQDYAEKDAPNLNLTNKMTTIAGGKSAYQYDYIDVRDREFPTRVVTVASNGYIIELVGINKTGQTEFKVFDLILSTFKFLPSESSDQEEEICGGMTLSKAREIALESSCVEEGSLTGTSFCNENTGTWWIDLDIEKEGCAPACVIDVSTKEAVINWRCTGLIPD